jgi:protein disulfide-isomerase-like protein
VVKTVVGTTFDAIVNDPKNDVLIEFYAPWCGHCKTLEPVYKKIAKKLSKVEGIVLAKIDATANDFPTYYEVEGYPTLYLAKKQTKLAPIKSDAGLSQKEITGFLRQHSSAAIPKLKKKKTKKEAKLLEEEELEEEDLFKHFEDEDEIPKDEL